jgi:hypothetical protein
VRSQKLSDSMSQYLIGRIEAHPRIEIHYRTRITGLSGAGHLDMSNGETTRSVKRNPVPFATFLYWPEQHHGQNGSKIPSCWTIGDLSSLAPILLRSRVGINGC